MTPTADDLRADAWARIRHIGHPADVEMGLRILADIEHAEAGDPVAVARVKRALLTGKVIDHQGVRLVVPA